MGFNVFVVSYRGYDTSTGTPNEKGIKRDADSALDYLLNSEDIDSNQIFIFGRQLGGAVALYIAAKNPNLKNIKGLIIENTFTSISDMVNVLFSWLIFIKWLILRIEWNNLKIVNKINVPILFISGLKDELVPPMQMKILYEKAQSNKQKAEWFEVPEGDHNSTWLMDYENYNTRLKLFIDSIANPQQHVLQFQKF